MTGAGRVLSLIATLSYALIMAPIIVVVVMAFSADSFILFPPSGFSFRWFKTLVSNAPLMKALWLSLQIALAVTLLSLAAGLGFVLSMSAYITPKLLGGGRVFVLATEIFEHATTNANWPMASAMALYTLVLMLAFLGLSNFLSRRLAQ